MVIEQNKYIGQKKIKQTLPLEEKTPGGIMIVECEYEDGIKEYFSVLMYNEIVSKEPCDLSELRDKRLNPIVRELLKILCDWGIKLGELQYMSSLLNQSLMFNEKEALVELWSKWMPRPLSPDEVDLITINRLLKTIRQRDESNKSKGNNNQ